MSLRLRPILGRLLRFSARFLRPARSKYTQSSRGGTQMSKVTRRIFAKGAAAAVAVPFFIKADDKSGSRLPVTGVGEHQYECIHDWGELPSHIRYGNTHGVCEDSHGNIYVHHTVHPSSQSSDAVVVFDARGKFVRSWGSQYKDGAHGLYLRKEGSNEFLYLCDQLHGIVTK